MTIRQLRTFVPTPAEEDRALEAVAIQVALACEKIVAARFVVGCSEEFRLTVRDAIIGVINALPDIGTALREGRYR